MKSTCQALWHICTGLRGKSSITVQPILESTNVTSYLTPISKRAFPNIPKKALDGLKCMTSYLRMSARIPTQPDKCHHDCASPTPCTLLASYRASHIKALMHKFLSPTTRAESSAAIGLFLLRAAGQEYGGPDSFGCFAGGQLCRLELLGLSLLVHKLQISCGTLLV